MKSWLMLTAFKYSSFIGFCASIIFYQAYVEMLHSAYKYFFKLTKGFPTFSITVKTHHHHDHNPQLPFSMETMYTVLYQHTFGRLLCFDLMQKMEWSRCSEYCKMYYFIIFFTWWHHGKKYETINQIVSI